MENKLCSICGHSENHRNEKFYKSVLPTIRISEKYGREIELKIYHICSECYFEIAELLEKVLKKGGE